MEDEQVRLIKEAGECLKCGRTIRECKNDRLKKMMKKIAANAVAIGLYNFNCFVIGNIADGDFESIKSGWEDARVGMVKCLAIVNNEGEDIKDILSLEEIEDAVRFTIFELKGGENEG